MMDCGGTSAVSSHMKGRKEFVRGIVEVGTMLEEEGEDGRAAGHGRSDDWRDADYVLIVNISTSFDAPNHSFLVSI